MRRPVRNPLIGIAVGVVGLAGITVAQDIPNRHHVEQELAKRSESALAAGGVSGATVTFTGRDGTVLVTSAGDRDRAYQIVSAQDGVRVVTVKAPPAPAPAPSPSASPTGKADPQVTATVNGAQISLTGTVPDKSVLVGALGTVEDHLTVDASTGDTGLADVTKVIKALGKDAENVTVTLAGGKISVTGSVTSQATKDAVDAAATVDDRLTVVPSVQTQLGTLPNVAFENNSAQLTAAGQAAVAQVAGILKAHPTVHVSIEGHTDSNGTAASNLTLSQARAQTVLQTLVSEGIDPGRLTATGFGATRPKVPDTSPANQAINRRVEFIVVSQ